MRYKIQPKIQTLKISIFIRRISQRLANRNRTLFHEPEELRILQFLNGLTQWPLSLSDLETMSKT